MLLYKFGKLIAANFIRRINKFLIEVDLDGEIVECHLHDPGRLKEILKEGRKLLIIKKDGKRKTRYDAIAAFLNEWIVIHSGYHSLFAEKILRNKLVKELKNYKIERKEYKFANSRIDFLLKNDKKCLLEVKGCTFEKDGIAFFPDAPTDRGRKHVLKLIEAMDDYNVAILFLIMREANLFSPNWQIDKKFSNALKIAYEMGVKIIACRIKFNGRDVYYGGRIPIKI